MSTKGIRDAKRGDVVVALDCRREPLVRRVWEVTDRKVYILSEAGYHRMLDGDQSVGPIGFPIDDVSFPGDHETPGQ